MPSGVKQKMSLYIKKVV